jgi:asparagine synthase (glutamine-hydrolysing)
MCGIAGWVGDVAPPDNMRSVLGNMTQALRSRGPDAEGDYVAEGVALGHRRLIVIDPAGGLQPMAVTHADNEYVLSYNGELYNYVALRDELSGLGHRFGTRSDTEVVLRSYAQWGAACVSRLVGIFAFAVWDVRRKKLFLARDPLGVKPLFFSRTGRSVVFASEPRALLQVPGIEPVVGSEGLTDVFAFGGMRTPGFGVFKQIEELRAGHWAEVDDGNLRIEQYWRLESRPHTDSYPQTVERVRHMLTEIVGLQMMSDVPVAALLSGGLDSSLIAMLAARVVKAQGGPPLQSFTLDLTSRAEHFRPDLFHQDLDGPWALRVAGELGLRHRELPVTSEDLLESIGASTIAHSLPSEGEVETSFLLLCRQIKPSATVLLSGEGADEIFGGYPWFSNPQVFQGRFPWFGTARGRRIEPYLNAAGQRLVRTTEYVSARYADALAEVPRLDGEPEEDARMRELTYLNITRFLSYLLGRKDQMSMASAVEVRVPFCDHRLVEYLWNVPWKFKCPDGRVKGLLRDAFAGTLPAEVLDRKKTAYPMTQHNEYFEGLRGLVRNITDEADGPLGQLLDLAAVRALVDRPPELDERFGIRPALNLLDQIIALDTWFRECKVRIED